MPIIDTLGKAVVRVFGSANERKLRPMLDMVHEVNLLGSRCGPFPEALNALARQAVDVRSLISHTFPLDRAVEAFGAARKPENVKILLKINPRFSSS